ncbi:hypothetical protein BS47DRAFT_1294510 [Hydnum rufescens UP504]|uniref:DDE Tnp4 domain-containing protein n=1 Tax=Hydnum rufescens UP504 TaxID=1448309 RepID=A0A9P6B001_9AGAM|nr:hypothetical protein BS47DRAFT_1294510 [Hydnum rufescens UP504]
MLIHYLGYAITPYTICPFDETELRGTQECLHQTQFNKKLASVRIIVEHAFGDVKG